MYKRVTMETRNQGTVPVQLHVHIYVHLQYWTHETAIMDTTVLYSTA